MTAPATRLLYFNPAPLRLTPHTPSLPWRVLIDASPQHPEPADPTAVEHAWRTMRATNPRLYDSPILAVTRIDSPRYTIHTRIDAYRRLAVQHHGIPTGVRQLGVKACLTATTSRGSPALLLARRSPHTRVYPDMWELAPAGGVPPPPVPSCPRASSALELTHADLLAALAAEALEELALELPIHLAAPIALHEDNTAFSIDLIYHLHLPTTPDIAADAVRAPFSLSPAVSWEYTDAAWFDLAPLLASRRTSSISSGDPTRPVTLSPPTLDLLNAIPSPPDPR